MGAVEAVQRGAAGSGIALVAIVVADVAEIAASGPLQHVAAERRHVAELRTGGELERLGDDRIVRAAYPALSATSDIRAIAPSRRLPPSSSICRPAAASGLMSTSAPGRITSSFIRSISVVPPASGWTRLRSADRCRTPPRPAPVWQRRHRLPPFDRRTVACA